MNLPILTPRQREIAEHVACGYTNAQIGTRLFITEDTVKTLVKKCLRQTGCANRRELGDWIRQQDAA